MGAYFQRRLNEVFSGLPIIGEVRGVGLMAALEFVADPGSKKRFDPNLKVGARVSSVARDLGLIARAMPHGDILGFAPPLVVTEKEIDQMVDISHQAVCQVIDQLVAEGALR